MSRRQLVALAVCVACFAVSGAGLGWIVGGSEYASGGAMIGVNAALLIILGSIGKR